jgi:hypothetical protein
MINRGCTPALIASGKDSEMEKANLYEAVLLLNRGIDEAVHGLERLKRSKDPRLTPDYFDERLVLFEEQRARLNAYFCLNIEAGEELDADRFAKRYDEYRKALLDEVQVYRDVEALEQQRQAAGKPPKVRFLTPDEQREWESELPNVPEKSGDDE